MSQVRVGARLSCAACGTQVVVVKPPREMFTCCGAPMQPMSPPQPQPVAKAVNP